jgi:thiol-disulfide isomerase/thioredoxin
MQLLYFRSDDCGVCHEKTPVAEEIARSMGLTLEAVDAQSEDGRHRAEDLRIKTVPTLALVDGPRVRFRLVGRMITPENAAHLASLTAAPNPPSA